MKMYTYSLLLLPYKYFPPCQMKSPLCLKTKIMS
ncbi:hypothetical protein PFFCH_05140 [Plasmodium falciparum FCH/4]|uniref:Uncharacterized protein n=1 Tax=Plasmodium falciparum FCH/4 TaxID=1036724 RepID=A0A024VGI0_PLAFA|nr:hypothetical protein PFFCH_05140 [Plasmodium falciparum FCH/4]